MFLIFGAEPVEDRYPFSAAALTVTFDAPAPLSTMGVGGSVKKLAPAGAHATPAELLAQER
jgi:hypothetical protein